MTDINSGLSQREAEEKIARGECNGSFAVKSKSVKRIIADNIFTLFNLINVLLAVAVALVGAYRNMLFMGVILCNIAIGIIQEIRSKRTLDRLSVISAPKAHLVRDGREITVPVADIVPGDIMLLSAGNQLCADGVLAQGELEADESLLTGESDTVNKRPGDVLYSGSFVVSGSGRAEVTAVGAAAYANKIASGAKQPKRRHSEMMSAINKIISTISVCIVPFALALFTKALFVARQDLQYSVTSTTAAIIGMIPEGLVLLTSVALAVSSIRLARRQTLCQDLYCVESLARVDVLCLDKTGTITTGNMKVSEVVPLEQPAGFTPEQALSALSSVMGAENPTMAAISRKFTPETQSEVIRKEPFSSARKWSGAQFSDFGTLILGAPSFVLSPQQLESIRPECDKHAAAGRRVLILAHSADPLPEKALPGQLTMMALVVLSDEIRESAPATLKYFREQGVTLKVISGDDPVTVSNVAAQAGLSGAESFVDAATLTDGELTEAAEKYTVFGRVTPARKLQLVQALKSAGHKVAMTGDGVNDVLALREADCSVAMQSGSDAARCVSQLVLLNSDFSSMPLAVEEGRRCINNIQRSASLFLVKTIFSFLLAVLFIFLPAAYPFQPIQLTLISALFIGAPSFLLALEPNHERVQGSFLSNVLKRALPGGLTVVLGISVLMVLQHLFAIPQERLSVMAVFLTAAVCYGVLCGVCRPFKKWHTAMIILLPAAFCGACGVLGRVFYIVPLTWKEWLFMAVAIPAAVLLLWGLSQLLRFILTRWQWKAPAAVKMKKCVVAVVLGLAALYAAWLAVVFTDYLSLKNGGMPVFASPQPDGSYSGLMYHVEGNEVYIFAQKSEEQ
ncbi:MAG: HAD-IC family P-type ATPase [Oscillospiraceae bacterium]